MGGEEFALLLPEIDQGGALAAAERVRLVVEQLGIDHPLNVGEVVTISLGLAEGAPADWGDSARLLKAADEALYEAKAHGRNRFACRAPITK
jgi:diguanylate cyclase (GGDEF)-like protein